MGKSVVAGSGTASDDEEVVIAAKSRLGRRLYRSIFKRKGAMAGILLVVGFSVIAAFAPSLSPYDPNSGNLMDRLLPPGQRGADFSYHFLGTDQLGRDILSRVMWGSRVSIMVGLSSVILGVVLGVTVGLVSGFWGGWTDHLLMRLADMQLSFPFILLALSVMVVLGPGLRNLILVLGVTGWVVYARLVRGQVLTVKERIFVEAATSVGASGWRVLFRHILPNSISPIFPVATLETGRRIILEASLSFLGVGVPPHIPSLGSMVSDGRDYLAVAWWTSTLPGLAITLLILGLVLVGDWLAKETDPKLAVYS